MFIEISNDAKNSLCQKKVFLKILVFLANSGCSFVAYLVHIATFKKKQDSHCLVVPVEASAHFVIIDLLNPASLVSFIILNHCSYN